MSNKKNTTENEDLRLFQFLDEHEPPTRDDFLKDIVKALAEERRKKGLTQRVLNSRLGFPTYSSRPLISESLMTRPVFAAEMVCLLIVMLPFLI